VTVCVLTPTYNRAHLLPRLFESLCRQTFDGFEWLIVDDGSTDETRELVAGLDSPFPIQYVRQENAGLKVAWNHGVELVEREHVCVIGDDDWFLPRGLELLTEGWTGLDDRFVSVNARMVTPNGELNGSPLERTLEIDSLSYWYGRGIYGDTIGLARTDIVRRYPFPYAHSRSAPEALAFNRMARRYLTRFLPEPAAVVDYQPDGLSGRSHRDAVADAWPWCVFFWEAFTFPKPLPVSTRAKFGVRCAQFGSRAALHELARRMGRRAH
jgi:glycosyltransferase involved in cell wall biosynthesis